MRLVTIRTGENYAPGVVQGEYVVPIASVDSAAPASLRALIEMGPRGLAMASMAARTGTGFPLERVQIAAPIPNPEKILCIGLNYRDHAIETNAPIPSEPVVFNKLPTTLLAPGGEIVLPTVTNEVDFEAELVVVIGKSGRNIAEKDAMDYVFGYTCGNDVSARDWQKNKPAKQWLLGKSFDTFAPLGPMLVTKDEIADPGKLPISLKLNGETMQSSNTEQLIFSIPNLIAYISQVATLKPGDLIFTGTPSGVGMARTPQVWLKKGDRVEVEIGEIGVLMNVVG
jgi:2-keto-4-pentenoate hydratase/2-oxohepta-3-ene-1,7-dioic acid hydratase in catechol pathway